MTKKIKEGDVFVLTTATVTEIENCAVTIELEHHGEKRIAEFEHHGELHQEDLDVYISELMDILQEDEL